MNKKLFVFVLCLLMSQTLQAQAKKPLIAKGDANLTCGVKGISDTIRLEIADGREEKITMDKDVISHLQLKVMEGLKTCGYQVIFKEDEKIKTLKVRLKNLNVEKQAGKIASRMEAFAEADAKIILNGEEVFSTLLTATNTRTQPFVGHVIKKGKWAIKLMDELASMVASDSALNTELVRD